jgi:hypothetical protein
MDANGVTGAGQLIELSAVLFGYVSRRTITHGDLGVYAQLAGKMDRLPVASSSRRRRAGASFSMFSNPVQGEGSPGANTWASGSTSMHRTYGTMEIATMPAQSGQMADVRIRRYCGPRSAAGGPKEVLSRLYV